jgi:hypothetical protein
MSEFVTQDNVLEATDVSRIRRLMANAERLGKHDVVEKCRIRLKELKKGARMRISSDHDLILNANIGKIDFSYWSNKNTYYGDVPLNKSMRTAQTNLKQNFGLVYEFETCDTLIQKIQHNMIKFKLEKNAETAVEIFDLIQLWGGGMGVKKFYYSGTRFDLDTWLPQYLDFIYLISEQGIERTVSISEALTKLLSIHGLGMSFATKHLRFWSELPIFDDRISLLLYSKKAKKVEHYLKFLSDVSDLSNHTGLKITTIETSLFAFSQHYFANNKLEIISGSNKDKDFEIAQIIAASK